MLLVAFAALAFLFGAPAAAADENSPSLPDLPGMRVAEDATRGQVAPSSSSSRSDTGVASASSAPDTGASKAQPAGTLPDTGPITNLPGSGLIPGIGKQRAGLASSRAVAPDALAALAALGTILSVGGFLLVRNRLNEN